MLMIVRSKHLLEDKKYAYELNESDYEDIIKYGMAFYRKDCLVKIKE